MTLLGKERGEGNGNPLLYSCLENPVDRGAWWAAVHRFAQSWTRLKRLSRSSSRKRKEKKKKRTKACGLQVNDLLVWDKQSVTDAKQEVDVMTNVD